MQSVYVVPGRERGIYSDCERGQDELYPYAGDLGFVEFIVAVVTGFGVEQRSIWWSTEARVGFGVGEERGCFGNCYSLRALVVVVGEPLHVVQLAGRMIMLQNGVLELVI